MGGTIAQSGAVYYTSAKDAPPGSWGAAIGIHYDKAKHEYQYIGGKASPITAGQTLDHGYDVAIGDYSVATGGNATALGFGGHATGNHSTAIGFKSAASGDYSIAAGAGSKATALRSTAIGLDSQATGLSSIAVGSQSAALATNSVALGKGSVADEDNTVSVGRKTPDDYAPSTRRIVNVTNGRDNQDAATVGQVNAMTALNNNSTVTLKNAAGTTKATVYTKAQADTAAQNKVNALANGQVATNKTNISTNATASSTNATDIGANKANINTNATAINTNKTNISANKAAISTNATDIATNKAAISTNAQTLAEQAKTLAAQAQTLATKANSADVYTKTEADTAAQNKVNALANGQVATNKTNIGTNATDISTNKTAISTDATAIANKADSTTVAALNVKVADTMRKATRTRRMVKQVNEHLGLGGKRGNNVRNSDTVVLSASRTVTTTGDTAGETTADDGIEGAAVVLSSTKAAIERADGTEALTATNKQTVLRGGTGTTALSLEDQDKGNTRSGANFGSTIYTNAAGTAEAEAQAQDYLNLVSTPGNVISSGNAVDGVAYFKEGTAKPQGAPPNAIGIMRETDANGTHYKYITGTRLSGVGDAVNAYDAVNKGQLDSVDQRLSKGIADNTKRIDGNTQGIANVTAMASMPALPAGAESGFTAGVGSYSGKNAVAIGFQHRFNANTTIKVAAATGSNGKPAIGTGVSYSWGGPSQPVPGQNQQVVALQDQLRAQVTKNAAQDARMAAQAAENAALKQRQEAQDARMAALMARLESLEARARQTKRRARLATLQAPCPARAIHS